MPNGMFFPNLGGLPDPQNHHDIDKISNIIVYGVGLHNTASRATLQQAIFESLAHGEMRAR